MKFFRGVEERAGVVTGSGGTPTLQIQILDGHGITGKPITHASVGQRLTLDIVLRDTGQIAFRKFNTSSFFWISKFLPIKLI